MTFKRVLLKCLNSQTVYKRLDFSHAGPCSKKTDFVGFFDWVGVAVLSFKVWQGCERDVIGKCLSSSPEKDDCEQLFRKFAGKFPCQSFFPQNRTFLPRSVYTCILRSGVINYQSFNFSQHFT